MKKLLLLTLFSLYMAGTHAMLSRFSKQWRGLEFIQTPDKKIQKKSSHLKEKNFSQKKKNKNSQYQKRFYQTGAQKFKTQKIISKKLSALITALTAWWYKNDDKWNDVDSSAFKGFNLEIFDKNYITRSQINRTETAFKILDIHTLQYLSFEVPHNGYLALLSYQNDLDNKYDFQNNLIVIPFEYDQKEKITKQIQKFNKLYNAKAITIFAGSETHVLDFENSNITVYTIDNQEKPIVFYVKRGKLFGFTNVKK